jgi:hypothetical protein
MSATGIIGIAKRDIRKDEIITVVINMGELWSNAIDFQSPERKGTLDSRVALLEMRMDGLVIPSEKIVREHGENLVELNAMMKLITSMFGKVKIKK